MNVELKDILTDDFIKRFQDSFALSTGFGVVFVDLEGNHIGAGSNFSKLCQEINKTKEGATYCAATNRKAIQGALQTRRPSIYICHAGLVNIEIPLTFEGKYIGAITAGQVRCSDAEAYPKDNAETEFPWMKTAEAVDFFRSIKILSKQEIEATAISLENIANYIVQTSMFNKLQERLTDEHRIRLEFEKKQIEMEHRLKLAELDALQKQVTPHFMFNVLNSISRLISLDDQEKAKIMLYSFSRMLRYSLNDSSNTITLKQELEYIRNYLKIQKHRFSERLEYEVIVEEALLDFKIPYFSLQPLIENALDHGILSQEYGGLLKVICRREDQSVTIEISDDGAGMDETQLAELCDLVFNESHEGSEKVGLRNSYRRFKLMFGENLEYLIQSEKSSGTKISIRINETV